MKLIERGDNYRRYRLDSKVMRAGQQVHGVKFRKRIVDGRTRWAKDYVTVDHISEWYDSKGPGEWVGD